MSGAVNDAIAARSPSEEDVTTNIAVAGCSAARWCWGSNGSGCLGVGHQNDLHTPTLCCSSGAREAVEVADQADPSRAAASASASVASAVPAIASPSPSGCVRFTRISCGGCHTLAIDEFGLVWSWGENTWGQLGHGVATAASDMHGTGAGPQGLACTAVLTSPRRLDFFATSARRVRCSSVSAGWTHSACVGVDEAVAATAAAVNGNSTAAAASLAPASAIALVYSWGDNRAKQCGWSSESGANVSGQAPPRMWDQPRPVCSLRGRDVAEVHCAWKHTMARTFEGLVFVWGDNAHGQLGLGDFEARSEPTLLTELSASASAAAKPGGGDVAAEGALQPAPAPAPAPTPVATPLLCADVALGWKHSLLLSLDRRRLYAAGSNVFGQLGVRSAMAASEPEPEQEPASAPSSAAPPVPPAPASASSTLSGAAGRAASAKARRAARSALKVCRPQRVLLPLSPDATASAPDAACDADTSGSDSDTIVAIATGWSHALALTACNRLYGWGRADFGQFGVPPPHGTKHLHLPVELPRPAPPVQNRCSRCAGSGGNNVAPSAWEPIRRIACGSEHSLVVAHHDVWAAGWNEHGNRGLGHCDPTHLALGPDQEGGGGACLVVYLDGAHAFGFNCVRQLHACPAEGLCHSIGTAPADGPEPAQPSTDAPAHAHAAQARSDAGVASSASYSSNHLRCIRDMATGGAAIIMLH